MGDARGTRPTPRARPLRAEPVRRGIELPYTSSAMGLTLADFVHRRRQFLIAALGASLVLGMALVMSGMSNSFRAEVDTTVNDVGADRWVIVEGATGPTTGSALLPRGALETIRAQPGVTAADPLVFSPQSVSIDGRSQQVNLWAYVPDGLGTPDATEGRAATTSHEIVIDRRFAVAVGDTVVIAGQPLTVVGRTTGHSMFGGIPNAYVMLSDVQGLLFGGDERATIIAVTGDLDPVDGTKIMTNDEVRSDALRTMADAIASVDAMRGFMWAVAIVIIAGLMYVSALERTRDFAVMKAVGASSAYVFATQALQAVMVSAVAATIAVVIARLITPTMSLPIAIPTQSYIALPLVALVVGVLASVAGLRRSITVDPATAFA